MVMLMWETTVNWSVLNPVVRSFIITFCTKEGGGRGREKDI